MKNKLTIDFGIAGILVSLVAVFFAGLSWHEARAARMEAHSDSETAERSYVTIGQAEAQGRGQLAGVDFLAGKLVVRVSGGTPAYDASILGNCSIGPVGKLARNGPQDADLKKITPLKLPAMMIPGTEVPVYTQCSTDTHPDIGFVTYGILTYRDIFENKHVTHFCYMNWRLIPDAVATGDTKKWKQSAIDAGKDLVPCDTFNDGN